MLKENQNELVLNVSVFNTVCQLATSNEISDMKIRKVKSNLLRYR